jgi:hypothetical protein
MTIYVPLLYICMAGQCGFFQSENYTTDEQKCEQEIASKKAEYASADVTVKAICIDIKLERKKDELDPKLHTRRADPY